MIKRPLMTVAVLDCILSMKPSSSFMWMMREKKKKSLKIETAPLADLQIHSYTLISRGKIPAQEKFSCPCLCWAYYPQPSFLSDPVLSLACPPTVTHTPKKKKWQEGKGWIFPLWLFLGKQDHWRICFLLVNCFCTFQIFFSKCFSLTKCREKKSKTKQKNKKQSIHARVQISSTWKRTHYFFCYSH